MDEALLPVTTRFCLPESGFRVLVTVFNGLCVSAQAAFGDTYLSGNTAETTKLLAAEDQVCKNTLAGCPETARGRVFF